jgi:hypothetical protein
LDYVDLLKIDVEGYEPRVFAGATESLAHRKIRAILCEFNDYWLKQIGSSARQLWTFLADAGFRDAIRPSATPMFPDGCLETRLLVQRSADL